MNKKEHSKSQALLRQYAEIALDDIENKVYLRDNGALPPT
jgi:hypothetical protein